MEHERSGNVGCWRAPSGRTSARRIRLSIKLSAALVAVAFLIATPRPVHSSRAPEYHHRAPRDITSPPAPAPGTSICKTQTACRCEFENGSYFDLSALANNNGEPRFNHILSNYDQFYYYWNPCNPFSVGNPQSESPLNECKDVAGCQKWYEFYSELGYQEPGKMRWNMDHNGIFVYYEGGSDDYAPGGRNLFVYLKCDPSRTTPTFIPTGDLSFNYIYIYEVTSSEVCLKTGGGGGGSSSGISIGTYMCIAALVLIVVYIVAGVLFMKFYKQAEGKELIPNYTLWAEVPGLIRDGCLFIKERISGFRERPDFEKL